MAKTKAEKPDTRTQRQKFIDKARELGTDESPEAFNRVVTTLAKAPVAKKKSEKSKR